MEETTTINMPIMYVFVRKDIPYIHQAVQASHAVAKFLLEHEPVYCGARWTNGTMVFLRVDGEHDLHTQYNNLSMSDHKCAMFVEPDWGVTPITTCFATIGFRYEFIGYKTVRMPLTFKALRKKWKKNILKFIGLDK